MSAPTEVRDQARALREQGNSYQAVADHLNVNQTTVMYWLDEAYAERTRKRKMASRKAPVKKPKPALVVELLPLPDGTAHGWTRAYEAALAAGIDPLEIRDAVFECSGCSRLPLEGCVCVPVREEKAA